MSSVLQTLIQADYLSNQAYAQVIFEANLSRKRAVFPFSVQKPAVRFIRSEKELK